MEGELLKHFAALLGIGSPWEVIPAHEGLGRLKATGIHARRAITVSPSLTAAAGPLWVRARAAGKKSLRPPFPAATVP